jgi:hypothetical protein
MACEDRRGAVGVDRKKTIEVRHGCRCAGTRARPALREQDVLKGTSDGKADDESAAGFEKPTA